MKRLDQNSLVANAKPHLILSASIVSEQQSIHQVERHAHLEQQLRGRDQALGSRQGRAIAEVLQWLS
jgi:hypothetical protein